MSNINLPESDNFKVEVGYSEKLEQDAYLVTNKVTGIIEYQTAMLIDAWTAINDMESHLADLSAGAPSNSFLKAVESDNESTH